MKENVVNCQKTCRNTCAMLNEALRKETSIVMYYKETIEECNFPEVKNFLNDLVDEKSKLILQIIQKLNEIHVRSKVLDGISSSFNNIDG
jgi:hemerythrin superfamily protein